MTIDHADGVPPATRSTIERSSSPRSPPTTR